MRPEAGQTERELAEAVRTGPRAEPRIADAEREGALPPISSMTSASSASSA